MSDSARGAARTIAGYLDELGSAAPTPGGGSASAYASALGAALIGMVARLTHARGDDALQSELARLGQRSDDLRRALADSAVADETAFGGYSRAAKLPRSTDEEKQERHQAIQAALVAAGRAPLQTAHAALDALRLAVDCAAVGNSHTLSDLRTARHLLRAGINGAIENVRVNAEMIKDEAVAAELFSSIEQIGAQFEDASQELDKVLSSRTG